MDFGRLAAQGTPQELKERVRRRDRRGRLHRRDRPRDRGRRVVPRCPPTAQAFPPPRLSWQVDPLARLRRLLSRNRRDRARRAAESSATTTSTSSRARCSRSCGCSCSAPRCSDARSLNGGYGDYRAYIAPGVMAQAASPRDLLRARGDLGTRRRPAAAAARDAAPAARHRARQGELARPIRATDPGGRAACGARDRRRSTSAGASSDPRHARAARGRQRPDSRPCRWCSPRS